MNEQFISPAKPPDAHQREVTEVLIEECAEVQQRGTKLLRFGPKEIQPGQDRDNAYRLGLEIGDLLEVIEMALDDGLIPIGAVLAGRGNKRRQLAKFMQTRRSVPSLKAPTPEVPEK